MSAPRRVTVVTPTVRMDVGLPVYCTVAELIPQLVALTGAAPNGTDWALSRIGENAFSPGLTVSAAALRDGELLSLRPRPPFEAPQLFDDVVDAIASAARNRRGAWRPKVGRRLGIAAAMTLLAGTTLLVYAALAGQPRVYLACAAIAVALMLAGGALARGSGAAAAASACAGAGMLAALLAGLTALPPHSVPPLRAESLAVGFGAVTLYGAVAGALLVRRLVWFAAAAVAAGGGALIAATVLLFDLTPLTVTAVAATLVTALTALAPMISFRLAKLPLPHVPADMELFREDERPAMGSEVLGVTAVAAELLTGLVTALGAIAIGCCVVLLGDSSTWSALLVGLVGTAWLLRSRSYSGAVQRVTLVAIGLITLSGLTIHQSSTMDSTWLLAIAGGTALAAALCLGYAARVGAGMHSPFRARWLDILEYLVLMSLLPVVGAVLDVYNGVRDAVS